jgi:NAD(P)-dependent dehydrogenase (short-subunit alcohol dehydrogenase family)
MSNTNRPVLLISGAGEGLAASIATTFAQAGYDVVGLARSDRTALQLTRIVREAGGTYIHAACDLTQPEQVGEALRPHLERVSVLVHNAAAFVMKPFAETTPTEFEHAWRAANLGAFVVSQIVLPHMVARGAGTMIFTGATAALRGGAKFAAFASAKFALRGLAQALAREYGPQGVHVAHVVIDGLIDAVTTNQRAGSGSQRMDPVAIARAYLYLADQHPSAWTHELDLRPSSERF